MKRSLVGNTDREIFLSLDIVTKEYMWGDLIWMIDDDVLKAHHLYPGIEKWFLNFNFHHYYITKSVLMNLSFLKKSMKNSLKHFPIIQKCVFLWFTLYVSKILTASVCFSSVANYYKKWTFQNISISNSFIFCSKFQIHIKAQFGNPVILCLRIVSRKNKMLALGWERK